MKRRKKKKNTKIRALTPDQKQILYITFKAVSERNSLDTIWKVIPVKSILIFKGVVIKVSSWSL